MNQYCAIGNISQDITIFQGADFTVANTTVAVNSHFKDSNGEKKQRVLFMPIRAFGKTAENLHKFQKKGNKIAIVGSLDTDEWDDKETGKKRDRTICIIDTIEYLDKKVNDDGAGQP